MTKEEQRLSLRELCLRDLFFLSEFVLRNRESESIQLNRDYHGGVCDWLMNNKRADGKLLKRRMLMASRGTLKSTVANRNYVVWRIINNPNITILINSSTLDNSKKKIRAIQEVFEKNEVFKWLFPEVIPESFSVRWTQTEMCVPRTATDPEFTVEVQSVEGELTSRHYDLILDDDVVGKENSSSKEQIKKVIDYYTQSLQLLKKPYGERLIIGTLWSYDDLHNHVLENLSNKYDILVRSIWKNDRYVRGDDGKYHWTTVGPKEPLYPEMLDMEGIEELRDEVIADPLKGRSTWMAQYELKIVDDKNAVFKRAMAAKEGFWFNEEELYGKKLGFSLSLDPAIGESKQADDSVFIVRAVDEVGIWYPIELFGKSGMDEEEITDMYIYFLRKYPIDLCTMESLNFQKIFKNILVKKCRDEKVFFPFYDLPSGYDQASKINSELKIRSLSAPYATGKIRFLKGCQYTEKLLDQLWRFPKAAHDDYPDSLAQHSHLPVTAHRLWKAKEEIIEVKTKLGRYGEVINNNKSTGNYI